MKIAELRSKSKEELKDVVLSSKKELFNLRMQMSTGALEKSSRFKEVRRTIARAHTLMKEKELALPARAPKAEKPAAKKKTAKAKKEE